MIWEIDQRIFLPVGCETWCHKNGNNKIEINWGTELVMNPVAIIEPLISSDSGSNFTPNYSFKMLTDALIFPVGSAIITNISHHIASFICHNRHK